MDEKVFYASLQFYLDIYVDRNSIIIKLQLFCQSLMDMGFPIFLYDCYWIILSHNYGGVTHLQLQVFNIENYIATQPQQKTMSKR